MEKFYTLKFEVVPEKDNLKLISNNKLIAESQNTDEGKMLLLKVWVEQHIKHIYSPKLRYWEQITKRIGDAGYNMKKISCENKNLSVYVIQEHKHEQE